TLSVAEESIQQKAVVYDRAGDAHYDTISAFIKSMRASDQQGAMYWLAKMLHAGEDFRFIARRIVIFASEDIGLADPEALPLAVATQQAGEFVDRWRDSFALSVFRAQLSRFHLLLGHSLWPPMAGRRWEFCC